MSVIKVYGIPGSPFLRAVEVTLKEKGLPYELKVMGLGEQKSDEHLQRHPFARIPVFEHDGHRVYETQAILRYLDDKFPSSPLMPRSAEQRSLVNQVIGIIECYFFPKAAAPIGFNRIIGPKLLGVPGDDAAVADAMPMARTSFKELSRILGDMPFFGGNALSLADIMLGCQLDLFGECEEGRSLISGTPNLEAWLERVTARPSFAESAPPQILRAA